MIGDKIYQIRKQQNLSQEEFANSIGVTRQVVSKWETNQTIPGIDKLKKISDYYNVSYDELFKNTRYYQKEKKHLKKSIILFVIIIIIEIMIICISSSMANKGSNKYKCLGVQTYHIEKIYAGEDDNYFYITLRKYQDTDIKTVKLSNVISMYLEENKSYEFIFRTNEKNYDIDYIFTNNEIIKIMNVTSYTENINNIDCKKE